LTIAADRKPPKVISRLGGRRFGGPIFLSTPRNAARNKRGNLGSPLFPRVYRQRNGKPLAPEIKVPEVQAMPLPVMYQPLELAVGSAY